MIFINEFAPLSPDFKFIESAGGDFTECWILTQDLDHYHKEKKKNYHGRCHFHTGCVFVFHISPPKCENSERLEAVENYM